jgi:hypothetical protein
LFVFPFCKREEKFQFAVNPTHTPAQDNSWTRDDPREFPDYRTFSEKRTGERQKVGTFTSVVSADPRVPENDIAFFAAVAVPRTHLISSIGNCGAAALSVVSPARSRSAPVPAAAPTPVVLLPVFLISRSVPVRSLLLSHATAIRRSNPSPACVTSSGSLSMMRRRRPTHSASARFAGWSAAVCASAPGPAGGACVAERRLCGGGAPARVACDGFRDCARLPRVNIQAPGIERPAHLLECFTDGGRTPERLRKLRALYIGLRALAPRPRTIRGMAPMMYVYRQIPAASPWARADQTRCDRLWLDHGTRRGGRESFFRNRPISIHWHSFCDA